MGTMMPGSFANHDRTRGALPVHLFGGTEGSNPSPSSGESGTNRRKRKPGARPTRAAPSMRCTTASCRWAAWSCFAADIIVYEQEKLGFLYDGGPLSTH